MPETLLIVSADDFGLTPGVCEGILRCHDEGIVTSTSVLATGAAFSAHETQLRDSGLDIGVHLAIVGEDPPVLSAREIPTLMDRSGHLPMTWKRLLSWSVAGRIDPADIRREFAAQLEVVMQGGLVPTHLDTHQHIHLWPPIGELLVELARGIKVPAIRVPRSRSRRPTGLGVNLLAQRLSARAAQGGLATPSWFAGLDEAGGLDSRQLEHVLRRAALEGPPSAEVAVHPGIRLDPDRSRYRWGYQWPLEEAALRARSIQRLLNGLGLRLGTFADLADLETPTAHDAA